MWLYKEMYTKCEMYIREAADLSCYPVFTKRPQPNMRRSPHMLDVQLGVRRLFTFEADAEIATAMTKEFHTCALKLFSKLRAEFSVNGADCVTAVIEFDFEVHLWQALFYIAWLLKTDDEKCTVPTEVRRKNRANRTDYLLPSSAEDCVKFDHIQKGGFARALKALKNVDMLASNAMRAYMLTFLMEADKRTLVRGHVGSSDQGYTPAQSRIALAIKIHWARLLGTLSDVTLQKISSTVGLGIGDTKKTIEAIRASLLAKYTGSGCVSRNTDTYAGVDFVAKLVEIIFVAIMPIRHSIKVGDIDIRTSLVGILVAEFIAPGGLSAEIRKKLDARLKHLATWTWTVPKKKGAPLAGHHVWLQDSGDKDKSTRALHGTCDPLIDCPDIQELLSYARTTPEAPGPPITSAAPGGNLAPLLNGAEKAAEEERLTVANLAMSEEDLATVDQMTSEDIEIILGNGGPRKKAKIDATETVTSPNGMSIKYYWSVVHG